MVAPQQGMALGVFLRYCSKLEELRLEGRMEVRFLSFGGSAQLCTAAGLEGLLSGLESQRLPLRSLLFGGCGVAEEAAPFLGRFLRQCPELQNLSLAGNRKLCTAVGLQKLLQSWAGLEIHSLYLPNGQVKGSL